jgi:glyoxylase-like metal-dependent hydrolase (beta-lactamase superfamily II)
MKVRVDTKPLAGPLPGGREGATVAVEPILTGTMRAPRAYLERASRLPGLRMLGVGSPGVTIPIPAFVIHHPSAGPFLIDTGLHASVASKPAENLGRFFGGGRASPRIEAGEDLPAQLRGRGVDPKAVRLVVMTHMHFDHTSGMSQFPGATFVTTDAEWEAATGESRPLLHGYRPAHFDYAFDYRTINYDAESVSSYANFGRTFDLFGDGSVRLASTPGHSAGHQSVICRGRDLHDRSARGRPRAAATRRPPQLAALDAGAAPVRAHLSEGRDHPGPRPGALGDAREALRVNRFARRRCRGRGALAKRLDHAAATALFER